MKCPAQLSNEAERLDALAAYGLNDELIVPSLEPVVKIAARMFNMPVAAVNIIGSDHVFFAASIGIVKADMRRDVSFCAHAINQPKGLIVPDARLDERFHDNPLVTGAANLRFYAGVPILSAEGMPLGALCIIDDRPHFNFTEDDENRLLELSKMASDRLELKRIEHLTSLGRPAFDKYTEGLSVPIIWFDEKNAVLNWNTAAAEAFGYSIDDGKGLLIQTLICDSDFVDFESNVRNLAAYGGNTSYASSAVINGVRKDSKTVKLGYSLFSWFEGDQRRFEVVFKSVTPNDLEIERLRDAAKMDPLTGLWNRAYFYRSVEELVVEGQCIVILIIDLDGFKDINDTLGHDTGDKILETVGLRILSHVGTIGLVARIGGDEFGIMLTENTDQDLVIALAVDLISEISESIHVGAQEVRIVASCGAAKAPTQAQEALELIGNADLALYKAKSKGPGQFYWYADSLRSDAATRRLYAMELYRAVSESEFVLYYQPQVNLNSQKIVGAEALIRWKHPTRGLLTPAAFLPALENSPLALIVGSWVLDEACAQAAYWRRNGATDLRIGVNLFATQFSTGDLAGEIIDILKRHGLPPQALEIEITENIALKDDESVLKILNNIHAQGVALAFDDFGTGYASLSLLKIFPITKIKIDQTFIRTMLDDKKDASVVQATLDIARSFDIEVIAEGIETAAQRQNLISRDCLLGQGYLFGKPMPAMEFSALLDLGNVLDKLKRQVKPQHSN